MRAAAFLFALCLCATARADFLVCCDGAPPTYPSSAPALQPDSFQLSFDGKPAVSSPAVAQPDGSRILKFDLAPLNLAQGAHSVSVVAIKAGTASSTGGSSAAVNFPFSVGGTAAPGNVHLSR